MEIFKGKANEKGISNIDLSEEGKHLAFSLDDLNRLSMVVFYDDPTRKCGIGGTETFVIPKDEKSYGYKTLDQVFAFCGGKAYFLCEHAFVSLEKAVTGDYTFYFEQDMDQIGNNRINAMVVSGSYKSELDENNALRIFFHRMQDYDPELHQTPTSEVKSTGNGVKKQKTIETK